MHLILSAEILGLFIAGYALSWIMYARFLHPLRHIPGPFWASVTRLWMVHRIRQGDMEVVQRRLHAQYGPLVRIAPDEVACADPDAIRNIYRTQAPLAKTHFYPVWGSNNFSKYPDLFVDTDEKLHSSRRRIVNNVYSMSTILTLEAYIDDCSAVLLQRLDEFAASETVVNLGQWLHWYAFDVIGEIFFGKAFGFMSEGKDYQSYIQSLETLVPVICQAAVASPMAQRLILGSASINPATRKAMKAMAHIENAAHTSVDSRLQDEETGRQDLLRHLLDIMRSKGDKVDFGIGEVKLQAFSALFAGADTTAIALRSVFYHLLKHPHVLEELRLELDTATREGRLSNPPRFAEASKLPLLSATIKEAMRLHPSVGLTMPRIVGDSGLEVAGTVIPKGWKIGMNAAVVGRSKAIYGPDADEFRPQRWLESGGETLDRYSLVFGGGTRTCIGKNISLSEIHKVVPLIIQRYDISLKHPERDWTTKNAWFNKQEGLDVLMKRRKTDF
ncbi:cytochrome P450 [Aureobasidium sp. EXF-10727]|nr:cytochrome P450 [Aureobasidium sp. EXF-10727]